MPRQFVFNERIAPKPPQTALTDTLDKAFGDKPLCRTDKNLIACALYGIGGNGNGHVYRLMGWEWNMRRAKQMRRILVALKYETGVFRAYYAPDKTSLRTALHHSPIHEMIYADEERD